MRIATFYIQCDLLVRFFLTTKDSIKRKNRTSKSHLPFVSNSYNSILCYLVGSLCFGFVNFSLHKSKREGLVRGKEIKNYRGVSHEPKANVYLYA